MNENVWSNLNKEQLANVDNLCMDYKSFISKVKTERECIKQAVNLARLKGFKSIEEIMQKNKKLVAGDKVYGINMDKAIVLLIVGKQPFEFGLNIIGSHIDSPRLDLKANPIYENSELCMLDTHYYGGIKKYQWVALPLAIHGVIVKKNGEKIDVVLGEEENDPVFAISDLLPHLSSKDLKVMEIKGEALNIIAAAIPDKSSKTDKVKSALLKILKKHNIEEEDLFSSEIEIVPSGKARDLGFDRSMIMAYGQDDRVCAYTSLMAILASENPDTTAVCLLVDKEEIGSYGATGMKSKFFENFIAEVMNLTKDYTELKLRRALNKSQMISSDVTAAYDPNYPDPMNKETEAFLSKGISFNKYTGSAGKKEASDANPEFIAILREMMDKNDIHYQFTEMGKVDEGGGGTIAYVMAEYGMNVIDAGVPLLCMHAPWEIASKVDIVETYKCYKAFYGLNNHK
ncbi:MAG: aminopeptidase [Clostridia bacterium]